MQQAVLIIGMHRSGTSALTRLVNLLGVDLGGGLMEAAEDNEKGFFEQEDVVVVQEKLLTRLGHAWHTPCALEEGWQQSVPGKEAAAALKNIIKTQYGASDCWGVKDPRTSITVPLWLELLEKQKAEPHFLVAYRHPMEVAASLQKRDGLPIESGLAIWLHYHVMAERYSRGKKRAIISYEALLKNWQSEMERASERASIRWPVAYEDAKERIDGFLSASLRHHTKHPALPESPITDLVKRAIALTEIWHKQGKASAADWNKLYDDWHKATDFMAPLMRAATLDALHHSPLQVALDEAQAIVTEQSQAIAEMERELEEKQAHLSEATRVIEQHEQLIWYMRRSISWRVTAPLRVFRRR